MNKSPSSFQTGSKVAAPVFTLPWLRQLRWAAVIGQTVTVAFVTFYLRIALPLPLVFACIAVTALSNALLQFIPAGRGERPALLAGLLAADVIVLTNLLRLTGGIHNPFASFYLVHVALAAVALPPLWAGFVASLCCLGYGLLYVGYRYFALPSEAVCGVGPHLPIEIHHRGMLAAFVLTSASVVYFVGQLQHALRRREAELTKARSHAAQNERFAALATLAAGAAHELGTPLGTIVIAAGEVARAAKSFPNEPDLMDDALLICEEAGRCRAILDRLQQQAGDVPRKLPTGKVLGDLRARFPGVSLLVSHTTAPEYIFAPPEALAQALASLVKNAIDASPGQVPASVAVNDLGGWVEFAITDRGAGLTPEALRHAGEPFFTTKGKGHGTGLGLFLVKLLAQRLDGEFLLEAVPGGGTRASLRLPPEPL